MADNIREQPQNDPDESSILSSRRHFLMANVLWLSTGTAGCFSALQGSDGTPTGTRTDQSPTTIEKRGDETPTKTRSEYTDEHQPTGSIRNTITVSPQDRNEKAVSDQLFGRLHEHYCAGTIYPGIYSEHIKNPSFFPRTWDREENFFDSKTFFDPASISRHENIPFPWEPIEVDGVTFEQREGGVASVDTTVYQRTIVDEARGGIAQKIVLPDFRTLAFDLALSVRGDGVEALTVTIAALQEPAPQTFEVGETVASAEVNVTSDWERHELELELLAALGDQFSAGDVGVETPYGEYIIQFTTTGSGYVDLDWISLAASDAVNRLFNPTTVELLREQNTTWLKWPGGNFTSQYAWRDGIGPIEERQSRFNHAWGGVEPNYFGTDEYLELCELCDLTPRITVGWWDNPPDWAAERQILPEDAAAWVEYCNGSQDTEMGALRAENGHPEPYEVGYWEIGNEVYGEWQRGDTQDPDVFASGGGPENRIGFTAYYDAMTSVDDSINVYADAMSPMYQEPNLPDPQNWNATLFEHAGERLDGVDLHHYTWGIRDTSRRQQWYQANTDGTPEPGYWDYSEVLIMFPSQFGILMEEVGTMAADHGIDDFAINVGEWGLYPTVDGPYPGPETMPGGSYFAGMLNAFIRHSDHVREACNTWVPVKMFPPEFVRFPPDPNPLAPAGTVHALYSKLFEGEAEWYAVDVELHGDGRTIPETGYRIRRMEDVPYVDAAAMRKRDQTEIAVFVTNRNLRVSSTVTIEIGEDYADAPVAVTRMGPTATDRPLPHRFQESWTNPSAYTVSQSTTRIGEDGTLELQLEPAAVVRLLIHAEGEDPVIDDDGVWGGIDGVSRDGRPYVADSN